MTDNTEIEVVGIDWGTTQRRAYGLNRAGLCVAERSDDQGALASKGRFPEVLQSLLLALNARPRAVLMSGMVGSGLGWQLVPYVDGAVALEALGNRLMPVQQAIEAVDVRIVPGYCVRNAAGQPDVMRGEETQLLGAVCMGHRDGWFVLPGTHSKWVELRDGKALQLRTYMTGELFDLLGHHGTLAAAAGTDTGTWDAHAFMQGVKAAGLGGALSHQLFSCRAKVVAGEMSGAASRFYLSGLLIGAELHDVLGGTPSEDTPASSRAQLKLIGSPALARHYQAAAAQWHLEFDILDAREAFIAATRHIYQHWNRS